VVPYLQVAFSLVVTERLVVVVLEESWPVGAPLERVGGVVSWGILFTVTVTVEEVVVLEAASRATAVRE